MTQVADMRSEHQQTQETLDRLYAEYETAYKAMRVKYRAWLQAKHNIPLAGELKAS